MTTDLGEQFAGSLSGRYRMERELGRRGSPWAETQRLHHSAY